MVYVNWYILLQLSQIVVFFMDLCKYVLISNGIWYKINELKGNSTLEVLDQCEKSNKKQTYIIILYQFFVY